jgi:FkbM family methyltransferase
LGGYFAAKQRIMTLVGKILEYQGAEAHHNNAARVSHQLLLEIEWYLRNYFGDKPINSAETGCGGATFLFARHSAKHTIYTVDDAGAENSRIDFVKQWPEKENKNLNWVLGDTFKTLTQQPPAGDLNIVLVNGLHFYPAPDFEFHALCERLAPNGILIIENTRIPTIRNLCSFISVDDDFRFQSLKSGAAFFQRIQRTERQESTDRWWDQNFNAQNFVASDLSRIDAGVKLPVEFVLGRVQKNWTGLLQKGFSNHNGRWFAGGHYSKAKIRFDSKPQAPVTLTLDLEPLGFGERQQKFGETGFLLYVNAVAVERVQFTSGKRLVKEFTITEIPEDVLDIELWHFGTMVAGELAEFKKANVYDIRTPNFHLNAIAVSEQGKSKPTRNHVRKIDGSVFSFEYGGKNFSFLVEEINDSVQSFHANGRFYEINELEAICAGISPGARILEVGGHVGNHTVFFSAFLQPSKITVLEPNRRTQEILRVNLNLNNVHAADLSRVDYALGFKRQQGEVNAEDAFNSGGALIQSSAHGDVEIIAGDELFVDEEFDFIKIDTEGMELDVLRGLRGLIARCNPVVFVEVMDKSLPEFQEILAAAGYSVAWQNSMYPGITNFLITHEKRPDTLTRLKTASRILATPRAKFIEQLRPKVKEVYERLAAGTLRPGDVIRSPASAHRHPVSLIRDHMRAGRVTDDDARVFATFTPDMGAIVDAGAHWGYMASSIRLAGTNCPIISFEANRANEDCLAAMKAMDAVGYDYRICGLSDSKSERKFYAPAVNGNPLWGLNSIDGEIFTDWHMEYVLTLVGNVIDYAIDYRVQLQESEIACQTLDSLLAEESFSVPASKIAVIKMDVEGHEAHVLKGAEETIRNNLPFLMIEGANRVPAVVEALTAHGYLFADRKDKMVVEYAGMGMQANGFWFHPERRRQYETMGLLVSLP